jgi:hypothetical protein
MRKKAILTLGMVLLGSACPRSSQFKKEEEFGRDDAVPSYYANKTLTQKIESMGQPKKRVVVLNFWNDTPVRENHLGPYVADELRRGLFLSQRVVLPTDAKSEMNTEDFLQGDQVKVAQLIREGRRMGVAVLVLGRIKKIVFRQRGDEIGLFRQKQSFAAVDLEIKLFDVQSGREMMATSKSAEASSNTVSAMENSDMESPEYRAELARYAAREAVAGFVPDVLKSVEKMTWQGRISRILGRKVYVNAGKTSGLITGDILRVTNAGEDVYDATSGAYLGQSQSFLKGTLEIVDFIGPDGAVAEIHTGGNFREGDLVQLY